MMKKHEKMTDGYPMERAEECIDAYLGVGDDTDPQGSYTGIYRYSGSMASPLYAPYDFSMVIDDYDAEPVQDADDL